MAQPAVLDGVKEEDLCDTIEDFVHEYDRVLIERQSAKTFRVSGT